MSDLKRKGTLSFYRSVFALVLPMALQNLINVAVTAVDVMMLGKVSETVLAASSQAGQVQYIMTLIFFGLTSGAAVLTAQYWGKKETRSIEKILGISIRLSLIVAVLFTLAAWLLPEQIMRFLTAKDDVQVAAEGVKYLRIIALSYCMTAVTMIYLNIVRSVEKVVVSTVVYLISLVVNIILNSVLIFGLLGFPAMGIEGAAIATVCARFTEMVITVIYAKRTTVIRFRLRDLFFYNNGLYVRTLGKCFVYAWFLIRYKALLLCYRLRRLFSRKDRDFPLLEKLSGKMAACRSEVPLEKDALIFLDFLRYSIPVTINELMWGLGTSANAVILAKLGEQVTAANSVAQVTRQLATVVSFGIAGATAIMLGKTIGEGKVEEAEKNSRRFIWMTLVTGCIGAVIILIARPITMATMSLSKEAQSHLSMMMFVMAYFVILQAYNSTQVVGIFRSGGDTKFGLFMDVGTMWGFSILLGFLAAFVFHWSVAVVYILLMSDEIIKVPLTTWRYKKKYWLRNVTR